jgi:hypothetical protein
MSLSNNLKYFGYFWIHIEIDIEIKDNMQMEPHLLVIIHSAELLSLFYVQKAFLL